MMLAEVIDIKRSFKTQQDKEGRDLPLGTIEVRFGGIGGPREEVLAYPLNNVTQYPLIGEHVFIVMGPSFTANQDIPSSVYYYVSVVNIHGNKHLNPLPDMHKLDSAGNDENYGAGAGPVAEEDNEYKPGENFIESDQVKNHQPFEGDVIIEGRHGHSIRFSQGIEGDSDQYNEKPYWEGAAGSPILSISNGLLKQGGANKFVIENPDDTDCSIFLSSKKVKQNKLTLSQGIGPATPMASYDSPQVTINSDRLVFNSKTDEIILTGAADVIISTPSWAGEMNTIFTVLDELVNAVDRVFAGSSQFPTPAGGPTLINPETGKLKELVNTLKQLKQ